MEKYLQGSIGDALIISKEGMFSDLLWRQVTVPAVWIPGDFEETREAGHFGSAECCCFPAPRSRLIPCSPMDCSPQWRSPYPDEETQDTSPQRRSPYPGEETQDTLLALRIPLEESWVWISYE